jgi:uncharacterized protein YrzB (UPF0473 family)
MKKITLSLNDALALEAELNGVVDQKTQEVLFKGLLTEKMNLKTKYWLTKLSDKLASEKKTIDALREELIKKHGTEGEDGMISIVAFEDNDRTKATEAYVTFVTEMNSLLAEEKEFEYNPISIDDLGDISAEGRFNLIFKLIKED